jgi:hypothetical protein
MMKPRGGRPSSCSEDKRQVQSAEGCSELVGFLVDGAVLRLGHANGKRRPLRLAALWYAWCPFGNSVCALSAWNVFWFWQSRCTNLTSSGARAFKRCFFSQGESRDTCACLVCECTASITMIYEQICIPSFWSPPPVARTMNMSPTAAPKTLQVPSVPSVRTLTNSNLMTFGRSPTSWLPRSPIASPISRFTLTSNNVGAPSLRVPSLEEVIAFQIQFAF